MLSKSRLQLIKSFQQKKFRDLHKCFVVEGPKMVSELLKNSFVTETILAESAWIVAPWNNVPAGVEIIEVSSKELARISGLKTPNQVLAVVNIPERNFLISEIPDDFILLLDGISDPGNLGTILRTADWFGINTIICSKDSVEVFNPKVVQSTMGSLFRVKVYYENAVDFIGDLKSDVPLYGAFLDGRNVYREDFSTPGVLVIGSESHGISKEVERLIGNRIHIPSLSDGAESLNASVATAIFCSEIRKSTLKNI